MIRPVEIRVIISNAIGGREVRAGVQSFCDYLNLSGFKVLCIFYIYDHFPVYRYIYNTFFYFVIISIRRGRDELSSAVLFF